jgi:2,3-bisphosphoglycerate-independent phosphoglycerate mutase
MMLRNAWGKTVQYSESSMKYVVIIPDGAADAPQASLAGRTPFQAAPMQNRVDPLARAAFARSITIAVSISFSDCTPVL